MSTTRMMLAAGGGPIHLAWSIPFALLLGCIALAPFVHRHGWEKHYPKIAIGLGLIPAFYYLVMIRQPGPWLGEMADYFSFIVLLASLYIVSGGIVIKVVGKATPAANCVLLLTGAIVANLFGTTGAAMLLIRPYLRMNRNHIRPYHIIFFIFIVANVGGALTPIGDPPLFLGYLRGVPFWWVLEHLWALWLLVVGVLVAVFFVLDTLDHRRAERQHEGEGGPPVHILGIHNFLFIALIIFAVFQDGLVDVAELLARRGWSSVLGLKLVFCREMLMGMAAFGSWHFTARTVHEHNGFEWGPIREVAILFVGIFSTMAPALQWLGANPEKLPVRSPGEYYFLTGTLSSFLDNAPTYLTFLEKELGILNREKKESIDQAEAELKRLAQSGDLRSPDPALAPDVRQAIDALIIYHPEAVRAGTLTRSQVEVGFLVGEPGLNIFVIAISAGAVFFGACTYIGNGPNFMVKSIAESAGVKMPGFIGYIVFYTLPILLPLYILAWALFFRS